MLGNPSYIRKVIVNIFREYYNLNMFGLSKASKAKKIYNSLSSLIKSLEDWALDKKIPDAMWTDPYMIGYFFKTVALSELIINKKPYSSAPDQMIVKLCFENHICPDKFSNFEKILFELINEELIAKKEGKLNFDNLGNYISMDMPKDIEEFLLGNRNASRVIFLLGGVLKKEIQEQDLQIIEAKETADSNKEKDTFAAEKLGLKYRDMLPFYLSEIYLKKRVESLS